MCETKKYITHGKTIKNISKFSNIALSVEFLFKSFCTFHFAPEFLAFWTSFYILTTFHQKRKDLKFNFLIILQCCCSCKARVELSWRPLWRRAARRPWWFRGRLRRPHPSTGVLWAPWPPWQDRRVPGKIKADERLGRFYCVDAGVCTMASPLACRDRCALLRCALASMTRRKLSTNRSLTQVRKFLIVCEYF